LEHIVEANHRREPGKEIEIVVSEAPQSEEDETAYLLRSPANRDRLLKAIENVAQQRNLVPVKLDELH